MTLTDTRPLLSSSFACSTGANRKCWTFTHTLLLHWHGYHLSRWTTKIPVRTTTVQFSARGRKVFVAVRAGRERSFPFDPRLGGFLRWTNERSPFQVAFVDNMCCLVTPNSPKELDTVISDQRCTLPHCPARVVRDQFQTWQFEDAPQSPEETVEAVRVVQRERVQQRTAEQIEDAPQSPEETVVPLVCVCVNS